MLKNKAPVLYTFDKAVKGMNKIKNIRLERGMTQDELAHLLNVTRVSVSRYETGDRGLDAPTICALCDIFDCSADYLLGRVALPSPDLTPDEEELLLAWRAADDHDRAIVSLTLARYREESSSSAV